MIIAEIKCTFSVLRWSHPESAPLPPPVHGKAGIPETSPERAETPGTDEKSPTGFACGTCFLETNGSPLQYACLENPMDRGAWRATVHRVTKSQTRLSDSPAPLPVVSQ